MAITKSTDVSSPSVVVPVTEVDFVEEPHKISAKDRSEAAKPLRAGVKKLADKDVTEWIENLMDGPTIFSDGKGNSFKLAPNGIHGSVQVIDPLLTKNAYVHRAVQREKIKFLTEEDAEARMDELVDEENHHEDHLAHLMESLGPDASENVGMYRPGVRDEAEPNGPSLTPQQVWGKSEHKPEQPKNFHQHVTRETEFTI